MRWSAIAIPIVLVIDILVLINFTTYRQEEFDAIKQREYDIITNYACDAAMQEAMIQAMDTSVDYRDVYSITLDPSFALSTYVECMLRSLGWSITDENKEIILQEYTPFFVVAEADGFYIYRQITDKESVTMHSGQSVNVASLRNEWSVKLPFTESDSNYIYIYSMEDEYYTKYDKVGRMFYDNIPYVSGSGLGTTASRNSIVANTLNTAINQAITAKYGDRLKCVFHLPVTDTLEVKAATRPSIFVMFVDTNVLTGEPIVAVAGSRVDVGMSYIAYTRGGNKYYTYAYNRAEVESYGCSVEAIYSTANKAALAGYYPDVLFR